MPTCYYLYYIHITQHCSWFVFQDIQCAHILRVGRIYIILLWPQRHIALSPDIYIYLTVNIWTMGFSSRAHVLFGTVDTPDVNLNNKLLYILMSFGILLVLHLTIIVLSTLYHKERNNVRLYNIFNENTLIIFHIEENISKAVENRFGFFPNRRLSRRKNPIMLE